MTFSGDSRFQEDITVPLFNGDGSLRLRIFTYEALNAEYVAGAEKRGTDEQSIRLRSPLYEKMDSEFTLSHAIWHRTITNAPSGNYSVNSYSLDNRISYYPVHNTTLALTLSGGNDRDAVLKSTADYYQGKPEFIYRFSGKGTFETSYKMTEVLVSGLPASAYLPHTMARGKKKGRNHDITMSFDYRLSKHVNIIAGYNGRKFAGRDFEHYAETQLRALF
jgi:hypothetical protein